MTDQDLSTAIPAALPMVTDRATYQAERGALLAQEKAHSPAGR